MTDSQKSVSEVNSSKDKDGYLTGEIVQPKSDDPRFQTWKTKNNMVKSWLINSMTNEIGENFLLYKTAKEMWDALKKHISPKKIEQNRDLTVTNYYNILARHWQQLDVYEEYD
ncbi:hypothetical protein AAG906_016637 [Vitis piasezkii]